LIRPEGVLFGRVWFAVTKDRWKKVAEVYDAEEDKHPEERLGFVRVRLPAIPTSVGRSNRCWRRTTIRSFSITQSS
jgi:hypothetical protein